MTTPARMTDRVSPGRQVEVRDRFCSGWCRGFEVVTSNATGYVIRRCSDRYVLPVTFATSEVRQVV